MRLFINFALTLFLCSLAFNPSRSFPSTILVFSCNNLLYIPILFSERMNQWILSLEFFLFWILGGAKTECVYFEQVSVYNNIVSTTIFSISFFVSGTKDVIMKNRSFHTSFLYKLNNQLLYSFNVISIYCTSNSFF